MSANQIHLIGEFRREEALASAEVKPGMLLELDSDGKVKPHATQGGYAERAVAVEDALQGDTVSDTYASGALVSFNLEAPGAECQMLLEAGQNAAIGERLISSGNGKLICENAETSVNIQQLIAVALEALDLSQTGDVDTLIRVRIL